MPVSKAKTSGDPSPALLSPLLLSDFSPFRREPHRPLKFRPPGFEEQFDHDTLIYDTFRRQDGKVVLLGPPMFELSRLLRKDSIRAMPSKSVCAFQYRQLDRIMQIIVDAPPHCAALWLDLGGYSAEIPIQPNLSALFAGRRVLLTKSKNNDPAWVRDWVQFAHRFHGADALLLYDNLSDPDVTSAVRDELSRTKGIEAVELLSWPFKFGPQGLDARRFWDSDFCELGALEHARWRFLAQARSVQTGDVDELLLSRTGRSVFAAAEDSLFGVVRYRGRWVVGTGRTENASPTERRHTDYDTVLRPRRARRLGLIPYDVYACPPKWTVVPHRCPQSAQWGVHRILNWLPAMPIDRDFCYRHFREITSNWKYDRLDRNAFDPDLHEVDEELLRHFRRL